MKNTLRSLVGQWLFWILFFNFNRLVFSLYLIPFFRVEHISFIETLGVFIHSLKLDLATASYFMVFPFLILVIRSFSAHTWQNILNKVYSAIMIMFYSLTTAGEMGIYPEWRTKLNYKILNYFNDPSEIYNSAESGTFFLLLALFVLITLTGIVAYLKWFYPSQSLKKQPVWFSLVFMILTPGLLLLGMRGGTQAIPINQSESYFSKHNVLNIISVNNAFNLYISVFENLSNFGHNPYVFMDSTEARREIRKIYHTQKDTTLSVLTTSRPNVVVIILESWSADLIESLGGKGRITPEFSKLEREGILFTEIYASGARSEQGMASLFGGFPSHPVSSLTVQPDKYELVPSLPAILKEAGYSTAFYFGGQLIYGNIKGYIYYNRFEKIMEVYDFPATLPKGKLGIHDTYTMDYLANDLENLSQPFFVSLFTLSTHSPWDQPFDKPLTWGDNEREWINAALYTDYALGRFFDVARTKPWFDSTLFILVADHSHNSYYNWHPHSRQYHRIPLLWVGNVIGDSLKGNQCDKLGNQHDLASTLLAQLDLPFSQFHWSKNLFNPYVPDFAYFSNENGAGWIRPDGYFSFDQHLPEFYFYEPSPTRGDTLIMEGKAYLQEVFREYLGK